MEKSYDLILNMAGNPGLSLGNLKTVGLTADNTALESEEKYLNSQKIQNMAIFKDDMGNFSKTKFLCLSSLNILLFHKIIYR